MNVATEKKRFNALSQADAKAILAKAEGQQADFRSCWYCNGAHGHLKEREVLLCFACGIYYLSGYPAPIVGMRSLGKMVENVDMQMFQEALKKAE
jgi:hypothetical protein